MGRKKSGKVLSVSLSAWGVWVLFVAVGTMGAPKEAPPQKAIEINVSHWLRETTFISSTDSQSSNPLNFAIQQKPEKKRVQGMPKAVLLASPNI